jgi:hypothetical protein
VNIDSLTYRIQRRRDSKWECVCPQLDGVRVVHTDRAEAISRCVREAFTRFYEIDCESRFPPAEGTTP